MLNQTVLSPVRMTSSIPNHPIHPQNRTMTCAILSNPLLPLEHLHTVALSLVVLSSHPPLLLRGLIISTTTLPCGGDLYPTLDLRQISEMAVSVNQGLIQRTGSSGPIPTYLPAPDPYSAPLLLPTLKGPPIKDILMQAKSPGMILGIGVPNGITDDTIALTAELMTRHTLTAGATRLTNVMGTAIVNMIIRVLSVLRLLSTDKVTTRLPGTMMSCPQPLVQRIINNHQLRMVAMTDGCHRHPPLLL
jgi:hypothetical protein